QRDDQDDERRPAGGAILVVDGPCRALDRTALAVCPPGVGALRRGRPGAAGLLALRVGRALLRGRGNRRRGPPGRPPSLEGGVGSAARGGVGATARGGTVRPGPGRCSHAVSSVRSARWTRTPLTPPPGSVPPPAAEPRPHAGCAPARSRRPAPRPASAGA